MQYWRLEWCGKSRLGTVQNPALLVHGVQAKSPAQAGALLRCLCQVYTPNRVSNCAVPYQHALMLWTLEQGLD